MSRRFPRHRSFRRHRLGLHLSTATASIGHAYPGFCEFATEWPNPNEARWAQRKDLVVSQYLFNTRRTPEAFIGLQEVLHGQLLDILNGLNAHTPGSDWEHIGVGRDQGDTGGEMCPILYRSSIHELIKFTNLWLSETPDVPSKGWDAPYWNRIVTIGEFKHRHSGQKLVVFNTHFDDLGVVARQKSAELIVDRAKAFIDKGYSAILTGDFNSKPEEGAYQTVQNGQGTPFVDVTTVFGDDAAAQLFYGHEKTYTGFDLPFRDDVKKRIDYVFVGPKEAGWKVEGVGVLETRYDDGVANSDHRPVVVDLLLNKQNDLD